MKICLRKVGIWTACAVIYWQCSDFVATAEQVLRGRKNQGNKVDKEWWDAASPLPLCLALFFFYFFWYKAHSPFMLGTILPIP